MRLDSPYKLIGMHHEDKLTRLVENAFDFLDRALSDIEEAPKYSVIHFYAAIELFLKARLMAEHWSLVIAKPQDADLKKFLAGDFQSVTLNEAAERLDKVVQSPLTKAEIEQFRSLGKHRNQMVHFFHEGDGIGATAGLREKVAAEHLRAWYLLNRLLTDRWGSVFKPWEVELARVSNALKSSRQYLGTVYELLRPDIGAKMSAGHFFNECRSCGYLAAEVRGAVGLVQGQQCVVCELSSTQVTVECLDCGEPVVFVDEGFSQCEACSQAFEPVHLAKQLDEDEPGTKDYFESGMPGHCTSCGGYKTVVHHGGKCVCASCLGIFDHHELHQCDWCGEVNAGDMEDSRAAGCSACEGSLGHAMQD